VHEGNEALHDAHHRGAVGAEELLLRRRLLLDRDDEPLLRIEEALLLRTDGDGEWAGRFSTVDVARYADARFAFLHENATAVVNFFGDAARLEDVTPLSTGDKLNMSGVRLRTSMMRDIGRSALRLWYPSLPRIKFMSCDNDTFELAACALSAAKLDSSVSVTADWLAGAAETGAGWAAEVLLAVAASGLDVLPAREQAALDQKIGARAARARRAFAELLFLAHCSRIRVWRNELERLDSNLLIQGKESLVITGTAFIAARLLGKSTDAYNLSRLIQTALSGAGGFSQSSVDRHLEILRVAGALVV
jgi:hypothetical protein